MSSQSMTCISDAVMEANIYNKRNLKLLNLRYCNLTDEHIERLQPCIPYLENLVINDNCSIARRRARRRRATKEDWDEHKAVEMGERERRTRYR